MIMHRGTPRRAAGRAVVTARDARCTSSAIAFAAEVNRVGIDRSIACADGRIDLAPCRVGCDRPCARRRRALRALLAAIGLPVATGDDGRLEPDG